jgi:hypothetical protein
MNTISKAELQSIPRKHIESHITTIVEQQVWKILETATKKTKFFFQYREIPDVVTDYVPTLDDLMEAFQRKFPDCKVYYYKMPEGDKVITVDWS